VSIDGKEYRVNLAGDTATVNGEELNVELVSLDDNGLYLLKHNNATSELYIHQISKGIVEVLLGRQRIEARIENPLRRAHASQGQNTDGELRAPMPGVVVEILVEVGQDVSEGDVLVIMESMKMKMQMRTLVAGQVKMIAIEPGQDVEKGDLLVAVGQSI
jgi:biotin carboxyl carrier protein